jgi:ribose/xylose/arabinose/galactoside ABC-type transport system permease subunit
MSNNMLIYVIVALNAASHAMLIWRLKLARWAKWKYCSLAVGAPLLIAMVMRLMVAMGIVHGRVAEQMGVERLVTSLASMLLIAGPLMATGAAIMFGRKKRDVAAQHVNAPENCG